MHHYRRQVQCRLPRVLDSTPHTSEQQGPARDRLHSRTRLSNSAIPAPPLGVWAAVTVVGLIADDPPPHATHVEASCAEATQGNQK